MNACLTAILFASLLLGSMQAQAVADCSKPNKTKTDWMLCSSDKAAVAEEIMAAAFRGAFNRVKDKEALLKEQEDWRENVRDACNDVPCLVEAFRERASELETY